MTDIQKSQARSMYQHGLSVGAIAELIGAPPERVENHLIEAGLHRGLRPLSSRSAAQPVVSSEFRAAADLEAETLVFTPHPSRCEEELTRLATENRALRRAAEDALTLLDRQREEYNAHLPIAPLGIGGQAEEGPVAKALRAALSGTPPADPLPIPRGITFAEFRTAVGMPPQEQELPAEERALRQALEALIEAAAEAAPILLEDASCAELLGRLSAALAGARAALAAEKTDE